jgi:hypothetical protein
LPCRHKFLFTLFHSVMFALHRVLVIFKSSQHAVCPLWVPGSSMPSNPTASTAVSRKLCSWMSGCSLMVKKNIEILDSSLSQHAPNLGDSTTQKHVVLISACIDHMCVYTWPKHNNSLTQTTLLYFTRAQPHAFTTFHNILHAHKMKPLLYTLKTKYDFKCLLWEKILPLSSVPDPTS